MCSFVVDTNQIAHKVCHSSKKRQSPFSDLFFYNAALPPFKKKTQMQTSLAVQAAVSLKT